MCMLDEIRAMRDEIYAIARAHKAETLWGFASCARKEETPESDVDFLVKFGKDVGHTAIENFCSSLLGRSVDIVSTSILRSSPRFANRVCKEAIAVWTKSFVEAREALWRSEIDFSRGVLRVAFSSAGCNRVK